MKVFAGGIVTETNTFASVRTSLEDFRVRRAADSPVGCSADSSLDLAKIWGRPAIERGYGFALGLMAWAEPFGITTRVAYESLREELLKDLRAAMPVDVVLLMLHGAMVAEGYDDCEADIIRCVREIVGAAAIIGVELDLHCHLTEAMIAPADVVITYKKYPHSDINDRAIELFDLAVRARRGEIRPAMALFDCQMVGMYPTSLQPLRGFVEDMTHAERRPGILSVSFAHGFQFADLPHVGAKVLAVTDGDTTLAAQVAREFGLRAYRLRHRIGFDSLSVTMEEALSRALRAPQTLVVVADQSDNTGGGAPGDATFVLRWLLDHHAQEVAMGIFYDPEVVKIAKKAGAGARLRIRLGGKMGPQSGDPVDIEVTVLSARDNYLHAWPQESADPVLFPAGDVVALRCGSIDLVVSSLRCQCFSPSVFSDLGVEPARKRLLIPKSYQHFYNAFASIASEIIYMASPGAVVPDPRLITYRRLDTRRLYPWVPDPLGIDS